MVRDLKTALDQIRKKLESSVDQKIKKAQDEMGANNKKDMDEQINDLRAELILKIQDCVKSPRSQTSAYYSTKVSSALHKKNMSLDIEESIEENENANISINEYDHVTDRDLMQPYTNKKPQKFGSKAINSVETCKGLGTEYCQTEGSAPRKFTMTSMKKGSKDSQALLNTHSIH